MTRGPVRVLRKPKSSKGNQPDAAGVELITPAPEITDAEVAAIKPAKFVDPEDLPAFTVTLRGTVPKLFTSIVVRKGPVRAQNEKAAIARVVSEMATQVKKAELLDWEDADAVEMKVPRSPALPFSGAAP